MLMTYSVKIYKIKNTNINEICKKLKIIKYSTT